MMAQVKTYRGRECLHSFSRPTREDAEKLARSLRANARNPKGLDDGTTRVEVSEDGATVLTLRVRQ